MFTPSEVSIRLPKKTLQSPDGYSCAQSPRRRRVPGSAAGLLPFLGTLDTIYTFKGRNKTTVLQDYKARSPAEDKAQGPEARSDGWFLMPQQLQTPTTQEPKV